MTLLLVFKHRLDRCLGPLSGGLGRNGRDYVTIYYEIQMLE